MAGEVRESEGRQNRAERWPKRRQVNEKTGGASRARTDGLVVANDALSQLSYSPTKLTYCRLPSYFNSVSFFGAMISTRIGSLSVGSRDDRNLSRFARRISEAAVPKSALLLP